MSVYWNPDTATAWCPREDCRPARELGGATPIPFDVLQENLEDRRAICDSCAELLAATVLPCAIQNGYCHVHTRWVTQVLCSEAVRA